jgi:hypothetical protein
MTLEPFSLSIQKISALKLQINVMILYFYSNLSKICSSVGFLPNDEYYSGGMDCKYIHHTPKKKFKIDFTQQTDSKQIVNPPLIHSLASNSSMIAAGLGNSKCHLIDAQK